MTIDRGEVPPYASKDLVEIWFKKSCLGKFNVCNDYNKVIATLCRTLLEEWENEEKNSKS